MRTRRRTSLRRRARRISTAASPRGSLRRGARAQRERISAFHEARTLAIACMAWLMRRGVAAKEAAVRLGLVPRTMRGWIRCWKAQRRLAEPLGRPPVRPSREMRNEIIAAIDASGGAVGVPSIQALFPAVARREVAELKRRWRRVSRCRHRQHAYQLTWTVPGAVWAMDHSDPPCPIDGGCFRKLLCVRDLASGKQLAATPVADGSADHVRRILEHLIELHGPPLVIKSDNGSALRAQPIQDLLATHEIIPLYSPAATPPYNGAVEAGIGSLKTRAEALASSRGQAGHWTPDDVESARCQANTQARPSGPNGPTPAELFAARQAVSPATRQAFLATWRALELVERAARGFAAATPLDHHDQSSINRVAIRDALVQHGFLFIRRRLVSPQLRPSKAASIT